MTSKEVKKFCKEKLNLDVKVSTTPTKARWIGAWIPFRSEKAFPLAFRQVCLQVIYPPDTCKTFEPHWIAGNIRPNMIDMLPHEWEVAISNYSNLVNSLDKTGVLLR